MEVILRQVPHDGGKKKVKVIIDRFEGNFAVVESESGRFFRIPDILIPDGKEGDVVLITAGKVSQFLVASLNDEYVYVLTPNGKYSIPKELSDGAKPGDSICIEVDSVFTELRQDKIHGLMGLLFK